MLVYPKDESAGTSQRAATLRQKLHIKLAPSPSHGILTPGQTVPALILYPQSPDRVAAGVSLFMSLV